MITMNYSDARGILTTILNVIRVFFRQLLYYVNRDLVCYVTETDIGYVTETDIGYVTEIYKYVMSLK